MRPKLPIVFGLLVLAGTAHAELPKTLEEFQQRVTDEASDAKAAVKLWFDAVFVYTTVDKDLGAEMITLMMKDKDWKGRKNYFNRDLDEQPYIFRSYAKGATPENNYEMDPNNYELEFTREDRKPYPDKEEGEYVKLWLKCGGADIDRPIEMQKNIRGEYKAYNILSLIHI